jgi:hypothetical protein
MEVTRTIRYKGNYQEAIVLQQMLEQQGVHVELPPKGQKRLERAQRLVQEWQVLMDRAELLERHDREERELLQWLDHEPRELHKRHVRELRELDQRHDRERQEVGMPPRGSDAEAAPLVSLRQMFGADLDQVGVSLRSTGAATAIDETVEEFREVAPDSKVEVREEPQTANTAPASLRQMFHAGLNRVGISLRSTGAAAAIAKTAKNFRKAAPGQRG